MNQNRHTVSFTKHHSAIRADALRYYAKFLANMLHLLIEHETHPAYTFPIPDAIKSALAAFLAVFQSTKEVPEPFDVDVELDDLDLDLDDEDEENDDEVKESEMSPATPSLSTIQGALQKLLFSIYAQLTEERIQGWFASVLMRYIILMSCCGKGKMWQASGVISKYFAMLLFCSQLMMYSEMELHRSKEGFINYSQ